MHDQIPNLWPEGLQPTVVSPVAILRFQATALGQATRGVLEGQVSSVETGGEVRHDLDVFAPALNYKHRILSLEHTKSYVYPVILLDAPLNPSRYLGSPVKAMTEALGIGEKAKSPLAPPGTIFYDDVSLIQAIRERLRSDETRAVITSLIARSNDIATVPETSG